MLNTGRFANKTALITGASRGIGREIAIKLAGDGANIVICAKTSTPNEKLAGTIHTVAEEVERAGGKPLPIQLDIRDEIAVQNAVENAVKRFGGIDILVNNASAIFLAGTLDTPMKRYDLIHQINVRGTFLMSKMCAPYLKQGKNPHILNLSPPLLMESKWFASHVAYTMSKYGMSMCVLGMHEEFRDDGIAVNALWPKTAIWTAAMDMLSAGEGKNSSRKPSIVADAAYVILGKNSRNYTGNFTIDEDVLRTEGINDFTSYAHDPKSELMPDFFIPGVEYKPFRQDNRRDKSRESIKKFHLNSESIQQFLGILGQFVNAETVKKVDAIYSFTIKETDGHTKQIYLDLKNGQGNVGEGEPPEEPTVRLETDLDVFYDLLNARISPSHAFINKGLKIKGNMLKAMQLENLLKNRSKI